MPRRRVVREGDFLLNNFNQSITASVQTAARPQGLRPSGKRMNASNTALLRVYFMLRQSFPRPSGPAGVKVMGNSGLCQRRSALDVHATGPTRFLFSDLFQDHQAVRVALETCSNILKSLMEAKTRRRGRWLRHFGRRTNPPDGPGRRRYPFARSPVSGDILRPRS